MSRLRLVWLCLVTCGLSCATSNSALHSRPHSGPHFPDHIARQIELIENHLLVQTHLDGQFEAATLPQRMAFYGVPGVSIAVINHGQLEWAQGLGVRDLDTQAPVTETTLFQAGSISKPVFAVAVMRLVEQGRLELDTDVNVYLASWKVPPNHAWQPTVTLRQILSHSAGTTVHGFPGYEPSDEIPSVVQVLNGDHPANTLPVRVNLIPNTQSRYSGGGTIVAQQAVADVVGEPFPTMMRQLVLDPLDMTHSTYEQPLPDSASQSAASGYMEGPQPIAGRWHVYPEMAAAGLWTTPTDLAKFGIAIQRTLQDGRRTVLDRKTVEAMLTSHVTDELGLGFFLSDTGRRARFGHGGRTAGFVARLTLYRDIGKGAVIMANSDNAAGLVAEIERAIAIAYEWPGYLPEVRPEASLSAAQLRRCVGVYVSDALTFTVTQHDGRLFLEPAGQRPIMLEAESEFDFHADVVNASLRFETNARGEVTGFTLRQPGGRVTAKRSRRTPMAD